MAGERTKGTINKATGKIEDFLKAYRAWWIANT